MQIGALRFMITIDNKSDNFIQITFSSIVIIAIASMMCVMGSNNDELHPIRKKVQ